DHDDPARAELIRAQCELARQGWDDGASELAERVTHLLEENQQRWVGPIRHLVTEWRFRKGLLEWVEIDPVVFVEHAEKLFACAPVAHVRFNLCPGGTELARLFNSPHLGRLRTLELSGVRVAVDAFAVLFSSPRLARLTTLILDDTA